MSETNNLTPELEEQELGRRAFVAASAVAALAATAIPGSAAMKTAEREVEIKMPDGMCDAYFVHPASGSHPGVLLWSDAFGLRPVTREMAKRLAAEGYSVLVPNPFYRVQKAPVFQDVSKFDFGKPEDRNKLGPLMGSVNAPGNPEKDAAAYIAWMDAQKEVNKKKKIGTQGYCMGGPLIMRTAAALPERVGAAASFHGGGLVTDQPTSPHLLAPKIKAQMYFGVASNDDKQQPDGKTKLKAALDAAKVKSEVEVYQSLHGWCMADMPSQAGAPIYNKEEAEKAWGKLLALYKAGLA
jgi:carboxymethylenebutenolidase